MTEPFSLLVSSVTALVLIALLMARLTQRRGVVVPLPRNFRGRERAPGVVTEGVLDGRVHGPQGGGVVTRLDPHRRRASVSVVIPTLNEAECVGWVLQRLPTWVDEVVLVDGLSTDHTEVVARDLIADLVVVHQPVRGKGAALRAGFAAASSEIIVMLDADGSTNPAEIDRFVHALEEGADFVKGSRYRQPGGGSEDLSRLRSFGNLGFTQMVNVIYGTKFTDLCYGYCAFWRRHLDALDLTADGFEIETELVLSAIRAGLRIEEVPSFELIRRAGKSNLNAYRDGRRVLRTILEERPGRVSVRISPSHEVHLVPVSLASPGTRGWVPAGSDRRADDRRMVSREESGYTGPERRLNDRRERPGHTVTVYRAVSRPVETVVELPQSVREGTSIAAG